MLYFQPKLGTVRLFLGLSLGLRPRDNPRKSLTVPRLGWKYIPYLQLRYGGMVIPSQFVKTGLKSMNICIISAALQAPIAELQAILKYCRLFFSTALSNNAASEPLLQ